MLVAIHQPEYFPWLGFFEKLIRADVFVILDDVQFSKGDFHNRTRVKGAEGPQWLSVPVVHRFPQRINEVKLSDTNWREKHWRSLVSCYSGSRYFREFATALHDFFGQPRNQLIDVNIAALDLAIRALKVRCKYIFSSDLKVKGTKSELVLNICKKLGATGYYSGRTGSAYLNLSSFEQARIEVQVQNFRHPFYEQRFCKTGFISNLSVIDLLFNHGSECRDLLSSGVATSDRDASDVEQNSISNCCPSR